MYNCPSCGAPIDSNKCAYCGTVFDTPDRITLIQEKVQLYADNVVIETMYNNAIRAIRGYTGNI